MLTAKVQYAIVILKEVWADNYLVESGDYKYKPVRLRDISEKHDINLDFLEQVSRLLRLARFLDSVRGPGGGYISATDLSKVTLLQVMKAVEPSKKLKLAVKGDMKPAIEYTYTQILDQLNNITVV